MNSQEQYDFVNDRIDHTDDRVDALTERVLNLEADKEVKKARTLEYVVIFLILVEIAQGCITYFHHG